MARICLADVAAAAGVSPSTASLALNDPTARVAQATRDHVRRTAEEIGYRPNSLARGLRLQRTSTIGLISDQIATTPFAGLMIKGAQDAAREHGNMVLLVDTEADGETEREAIRALADRQVDAMVYACMWHQELPAPEGLAPESVMLNCRDVQGRHPSVVPDEIQGASLGVEELVAAGHRRIAMISCDEDVVAAPLRLQAYRAVLSRHGIAIDERWVREVPISAAGGEQGIRELLDLPEEVRPTGVFCFNDRIAVGAMNAARRLGIDIPRDLSIVGFDDQPFLAADQDPPLTTVALPHQEMGEWAIRRLLDPPADADRGAGGDGEVCRVPCRLVRRSTVAPPSR